MKRHFQLTMLLIVTLTVNSTYAQSIRKLMEIPYRTIEGKWEQNSSGDLELNYYNDDMCDYYLFQERDRSYNIAPGKNTIFRKDKNSQSENPLTNSTRYRFFRGRFPEDFNINTPYALPVKNGKNISWQVDIREQMKTMNFVISENDTIYATRRGIACKTAHPQQLLIYHSDHTFAAYLMMKQNFIHTSEEVMVGQPVGIAGSWGVSISYFFMDSNKFQITGPTGYPYSHFTPIFRTDKGDIKMEEKTSYKAIIDNDLLMQEMSKREKKKFQKQQLSK